MSYWPYTKDFFFLTGSSLCFLSSVPLCVWALGGISSISPPHAATRLPASYFRGDMRPSSPFNTAPAANIDWFSPTVGAQLSPSLLHLLALRWLWEGEKEGGVQEHEGMCVNAPLGYSTNISEGTRQNTSARTVAVAILASAVSPWVLGRTDD